MKGHKHKYRNLGIEYLHAMKPIFHPKWPTATQPQKMVEFLQHFRTPDQSIDQYANSFKRKLCELRYNSLTITDETAKETWNYIQKKGGIPEDQRTIYDHHNQEHNDSMKIIAMNRLV